jgi:AcrR family transcriptional regulator
MSPSGVAVPRDRSRRRRKATDTDEVSGRTQIIEAAIASILEVGFYRSSTNEIARRANVSWGALQYHFGTREALLLAIVKELDRRFVEDLQSARVEGDTPEQRIDSLFRLLARHYDSPNWLVRLQILLNLQHDPDTSADVMTEVAETAAQAEAPIRQLLRQAIGGKPVKGGVDALFHALRGFALSRQLAEAVPIEGSRAPGPDAVKLFIRGLAAVEAPTPDKR